jgi:selenocysteine lyase/cysteine desulfurase
MSILVPQRHLFDIPEDVAYFNCAYNSPLLNSSRERLLAGAVAKSHPWERRVEEFFADANRLRHLCAELFGGDGDGYAVIPAASYGLSAAARAIEPQLGRGGVILLMAEEFPSNVLPWRRVAKERGAEIVTVASPGDGDWTRAIVAETTPTTKVVAVSTCHWTNGAMVDLVAVGKACRDVGAILVVDATQSLGAMPLAMDEVRPDFLVAAAYKWLLCPYGVGFLYVGADWRGARPLEESWLARENARDFAGLVKYSDIYLPGARRFDVGETCVPTLLPGAIAAFEQLAAWGVENIAATLAAINARLATALSAQGFGLPSPRHRCPHMFGARLPEGCQANVVATLATQRIYISQRGNALRFAPHLHITETDIERLLEALARLIARG